MTILVTGCAGFIGYHVTQALLARGETVIGLDNLNDYYDVTLKDARLARLTPHPNFIFYQIDISDATEMQRFFAGPAKRITHIVHLAAQAGVRYSLQNPHAYITSNVVGHLNLLEQARHLSHLQNIVYASSSSVYGANTKSPFSVTDETKTPISLYAATKCMNELQAYTYAHLYKIPQTGLRFFTVYGPWSRPDMAPILFTKAILAGEPIKIFNNGQMKRDFTYIDDIVNGITTALDQATPLDNTGVPHRVLNLGNNKTETLLDFVTTLEQALGVKAIKDFQPLQPGDVLETYADIDATTAALGYRPTTTIAVGLSRFAAWYRDYYNVPAIRKAA